ncbi:hypothetical protein AAMO2058_000618800 [Amorphochlora amoebiformis]
MKFPGIFLGFFTRRGLVRRYGERSTNTVARGTDGSGEAQGTQANTLGTALKKNAQKRKRVGLRVLLIRHAESVNNALYRDLAAEAKLQDWDDERHADPPLTDLGWRQAEDLALRLRQNPDLYGFGGEIRDVDKLYTSPMLRAMQTTVALRTLKAPIEIWADLHETGGIFHKNHRTLRGITEYDIQKDFTGFEVRDYEVSKTGWWKGGVETYEEMTIRAEKTKLRLFRMAADLQGDDYTIALVSHGSFLATLIRSLTQANCMFALLNTGVSCLDIEVNKVGEDEDDFARVRLHYLNCLEISSPPQG